MPTSRLTGTYSILAINIATEVGVHLLLPPPSLRLKKPTISTISFYFCLSYDSNNSTHHHHQGCVELNNKLIFVHPIVTLIVTPFPSQYGIINSSRDTFTPYSDVIKKVPHFEVTSSLFWQLTKTATVLSLYIVSHLFPLMNHHLWLNRSGSHITVATTLTGVRHLYLFYFASYINQ